MGNHEIDYTVSAAIFVIFTRNASWESLQVFGRK